jgi:hypothetical protein
MKTVIMNARTLGCPLVVVLSALVAAFSERIIHVAALEVGSAKNLRPVIAGSIYRAASLDELSKSDAQSLLDGSAFGSSAPLAAVIDLRNLDEIRKGEAKRSDGATFFYSSLSKDSRANGEEVIFGRLINVPILGDVDGFWDEAIDRMDVPSRVAATLQTVFSGGALDRSAARNLEKGGLSMLYTVMMTTGQRPILLALEACAHESARGPVIIHCQKGKDRTGVLSMLIQNCLGDSDDEIIKAYGISGDLLGGEDSGSKAGLSKRAATSGKSGGMVDWSHFRGSPPSAMVGTLEWICQQFVSVDGYLDAISFDAEKRAVFRERLGQTPVTMDLSKDSNRL